MKKIDLGVVVTTLIIVTISCSFAFFAARIVGNPKDINLVAKNVAITFTDTSSIADETISPGWNNVKSFTITNNSKEDFNYNILLKGLVNTFESINTLQYKITSDTGYNMDNYLNIVKTENSKDVVLAYDVLIPKGSKQTYQVEFKYISIDEDQSSDMGKKLGGTLAIEESTGKPKIYDKLLADNPTIKTRTDFSTIFTETNVNTLYKAKENNTDVYYFAGDARNNWVKFGTFNTDKTIYKGWGTFENNYTYHVYDSMSECTNASEFNSNCEAFTLWKKGDPIYWRIIRTDKDGGVKLLYHGNSYESENTYIAGNESYSVNCTTNGINCIDYNNSNAKIKIDKWFNENLINYSKYINPEASYCNDKSIYNSDDTWTYFSGNYRLAQTKNPTLNCNSKDVIKTNIALITADEVAFAGGVSGIKNDKVWYYLNNKNNPSINHVGEWWTMTGDAYNDTYSTIQTIEPARIGCEGFISAHSVLYNAKSFRPVITLNGENLWKSGDGSATNPYEVNAEPVNMYTVSLTVNNGSGTSTVLVEEGKDATFTVTPRDGYKAELETDTCGGTLSGNTYAISNVTSGKTCSITFKKNLPTLSSLIQANAVNENGYRYEGSNPNNYIKMEKTDGTKEIWRIIGLFPDGVNGENVIRVRRHYEKNNYPTMAFNSKNENYWASTSMYSTLKDIYSLSNYKNTVNYVMHLGAASSSSFSLTASGIYTTERGNTAGATSSTSYESAVQTIGSVGLMYASDFTYAAVESDCTRTTTLINYDEITACHNNNWLYQGSSQTQWTLTTYSNSSYFIVIVRDDGRVDTRKSSVDGGWPTVTISTIAYSPVMALKSDVVVTGSGTQNDPYVIN